MIADPPFIPEVYHDSRVAEAASLNQSLISAGLSGGMAFDPGAIDSTLAAAIGDDAGLIAELRAAFVESAERSARALEDAREDDSWMTAASRLKGLAASFGAVRLMALAEEARTGMPFDPVVLRKIRRVVERL